MANGALARTFEREVLGRLLDHGMRGVDPLRARLLAPVSGEVVEVGFGSGANLPFYPAAVGRLVAVEPSEGLLDLARARLAAWGRPHEVVHASASRPLPLDAARFDAAVITFVLCSVKHTAELLDEVRRVLKPGAPVYLAEHVAAARAPLRTAQRAVRPVWRPLLGGCDPAKDTRAALARSGWDTTALEDERLELPWVVSSGLVGVTRPPR